MKGALEDRALQQKGAREDQCVKVKKKRKCARTGKGIKSKRVCAAAFISRDLTSSLIRGLFGGNLGARSAPEIFRGPFLHFLVVKVNEPPPKMAF